MSLRIVREKYYLPLPMDSEQVWMLRGSNECFLPVDETYTPKWVLDELAMIGSRCVASGLIVEDNNVYMPDEEAKETDHRVVYSVRCGLAKKDGEQYLHLSHIEPVYFGLYWKDGKCYQHESGNAEGMSSPTAGQMAAIANVTHTLLSEHKITTADSSQANPFLFALIIPISYGESIVKAFANDLFHTLNILPCDETMDIEEANHYCALDVDEERGVFLVIFNHPAIFNYPEDSAEGRCAYGEWDPEK